MRELNFKEMNRVSGGDFFTGLGVFLIFCMVDEIANTVRSLKQNSCQCSDLRNELTLSQKIIEQYKLHYGELPE